MIRRINYNLSVVMFITMSRHNLCIIYSVLVCKIKIAGHAITHKSKCSQFKILRMQVGGLGNEWVPDKIKGCCTILVPRTTTERDDQF